MQLDSLVYQISLRFVRRTYRLNTRLNRFSINKRFALLDLILQSQILKKSPSNDVIRSYRAVCLVAKTRALNWHTSRKGFGRNIPLLANFRMTLFRRPSFLS